MPIICHSLHWGRHADDILQRTSSIHESIVLWWRQKVSEINSNSSPILHSHRCKCKNQIDRSSSSIFEQLIEIRRISLPIMSIDHHALWGRRPHAFSALMLINVYAASRSKTPWGRRPHCDSHLIAILIVDGKIDQIIWWSEGSSNQLLQVIEDASSMLHAPKIIIKSYRCLYHCYSNACSFDSIDSSRVIGVIYRIASNSLSISILNLTIWPRFINR